MSKKTKNPDLRPTVHRLYVVKLENSPLSRKLGRKPRPEGRLSNITLTLLSIYPII